MLEAKDVRVKKMGCVWRSHWRRRRVQDGRDECFARDEAGARGHVVVMGGDARSREAEVHAYSEPRASYVQGEGREGGFMTRCRAVWLEGDMDGSREL